MALTEDSAHALVQLFLGRVLIEVNAEKTLNTLQEQYNSALDKSFKKTAFDLFETSKKKNQSGENARQDLERIYTLMLTSFQDLAQIFQAIFTSVGIEVSPDLPAAKARSRSEFDKLVKKKKMEFNRAYGYIFWNSYGAPYDLQMNGGFVASDKLLEVLNAAESIQGHPKADRLQKARAKAVYDEIMKPGRIVRYITLQEVDDPCLQTIKMLDTDGVLNISRFEPKKMLATITRTLTDAEEDALRKQQGEFEETARKQLGISDEAWEAKQKKTRTAPTSKLPAFTLPPTDAHLLQVSVGEAQRQVFINGHFASGGSTAQVEDNIHYFEALVRAAKVYANANACTVFINCDANFPVDGEKKDVSPPDFLNPQEAPAEGMNGVQFAFKTAAKKTRGANPVENQQFIAKGNSSDTCATMITATIYPESSVMGQLPCTIQSSPGAALLDDSNPTDHQINYNDRSHSLNINVGFNNYGADAEQNAKKPEWLSKLKDKRTTAWDDLHKAFLISAQKLSNDLIRLLAEINAKHKTQEG